VAVPQTVLGEARRVKKRLRWYLGLHRWQRLKGDGDAGWYLKCRDCGKYGETPDGQIGPPGVGM
jgi:hypothetical protein